MFQCNSKCSNSVHFSVEGVGEAVRLVHDILSEGGYGPAAIEGTARPASPPVEIANEPTEDTTGAEKIPIRAKVCFILLIKLRLSVPLALKNVL